MTLRLRLVLTIAATALPLVAALVWVRSDLERRAAEQGLREFVLARMEGGGRERCEANPEAFMEPEPPRPGPGRPPRPPGRRGLPPVPPEVAPPRIELWAYYPDYHSANPRAPLFPPKLRDALEKGVSLASIDFDAGDRRGLQVAVRLEWTESPCSIVLARRIEPIPPGADRRVVWMVVGLGVVLVLAVLFAAGPIVRRIRLLTAEVRRSAADRYQTPVTVRGSDEIAALSQAFNEAAGQVRSHVATLEEREEALRRFVANTTHDVMVPLTVLQGHLTAIRKQSDAGTPVDPALVRDSLEEAHYMASLVHNLGAAAKLEAGGENVQRHEVDLNALVERAVGRHRPIATQRGIEIDFAVPETPVVVDGDVTLIEQAVSNVIHNAVRYNDAGGHVAVLLERNDQVFSLRVIDDGPGIPSDQLSRLTERHHRGDAARTRHPDGLGLGLHIAKDVADRHGFTMSMGRSEHGGLEVSFRGPTVTGRSTEPASA